MLMPSALNDSRTHQFDEIWLPRIGEAATALLRRDQSFRVAKVLFMSGGVIGAPALVWSLGGAAGTVLGIVWWACLVTMLALTIRYKIGIAAEVSKLYDSKVRWSDLPAMNAKSFDRWAAKHALSKAPA